MKIYDCPWGMHEFKIIKPGVVRCIVCGRKK